MENSKILIYDGSFNGFLTSVFMSYQEVHPIIGIQRNTTVQNRLFTKNSLVVTQIDKAKRVWNAIQQKNSAAIRTIYFAFLSEAKDVESLLYRYICHLFSTAHNNHIDFDEADRIRIKQLSRRVEQEKHRMESSAEFNLTSDGIYFATLALDFNILPLLTKHFRALYALQPWIIYDRTRNYGIYYNLKSIDLIALDVNAMYQDAMTTVTNLAHNTEMTTSPINTIAIKPYINGDSMEKNNPDVYEKYVSTKRAV